MNKLLERFAKKRQPKGNSRAVRYATSPLLATPTPPLRSKIIVAMVGIGFAALVGKAVYVQVVNADFYIDQGESRYVARYGMPASRGRILDRNGQLLASSVVTPGVAAAPKDFTTDRQQRREVARLLGLSNAELEAKLGQNPNFVWLERDVDPAAVDKLQAAKVDGLIFERGSRRSYPEGEAAAHVVGFTNVDEFGQEGIELAYQAVLQGTRGSRKVLRDRLGRAVDDPGGSVDPVDGRDVQLSIDANVQSMAYQRLRDAVLEHKAKAGSAVVLDVQTGEVLALANYPSYDPSSRTRMTGPQLRNRALTDTFEPGSTMKPFIASWALETRRVAPSTVLATAGGRMTMSGWPITDAHAYGDLTVAQVIQKSSNIGTVRMAMQMQPREMWELFTAVGFGQRPQISFPGAVSGRLRPHKTWKPIEQATMSFGYGLSVSLFQLARAYTVFARDGEVIPVSLMKHPDPVTGQRVLSPKTAQTMREMLRSAADEGGTAPKARTPGYSVGGKTGTAYKQEGKSYLRNKYRSWFVGIAPVSNPRIVVAVLVDEPSNGKHYGGDVAAPVFSKVVEQTLRQLSVPPDLDVRSQVVAKDVPAVEESF